MKSEYRRKQEAKEKAAKSLQYTKKRLGIGTPKSPRGVTPNPLVARSWERRPKTAPTSDRIPGPAPTNDFMHAHKWKRGVREERCRKSDARRRRSRPLTTRALCNIFPTKKATSRGFQLPLFFRRSTSLSETSPASMRASIHACGNERPFRLMQLRRALLSKPYSPQYL